MDLFQNQKKRNPPNQVIGEEHIAKTSWNDTLQVIHNKTQKHKYFTQKAHRNNAPVS